MPPIATAFLAVNEYKGINEQAENERRRRTLKNSKHLKNFTAVAEVNIYDFIAVTQVTIVRLISRSTNCFSSPKTKIIMWYKEIY